MLSCVLEYHHESSSTYVRTMAIQHNLAPTVHGTSSIKTRPTYQPPTFSHHLISLSNETVKALCVALSLQIHLEFVRGVTQNYLSYLTNPWRPVFLFITRYLFIYLLTGGWLATRRERRQSARGAGWFGSAALFVSLGSHTCHVCMGHTYVMMYVCVSCHVCMYVTYMYACYVPHMPHKTPAKHGNTAWWYNKPTLQPRLQSSCTGLHTVHLNVDIIHTIQTPACHTAPPTRSFIFRLPSESVWTLLPMSPARTVQTQVMPDAPYGTPAS